MAIEMTSNPVSSGGSSFVKPCQVSVVQGKVQIKVLGYTRKDGSVNQPTFPDGQSVKYFEFKDLPWDLSAPELSNFEKTLVVHYYDGAVKFFAPYKAQVLAKFVAFGRQPRDAELPKIWERESNYAGKRKKEYTFMPVFEVIESDEMFGGVPVNDFFRFRMIDLDRGFTTNQAFTDDGSGKTAFGFKVNPNGTTGYSWSDKIYSLRHCGAYDGAKIDFPKENEPLEKVLLSFEQRMLIANKIVKITIDVAKKVFDIEPSESEDVVRVVRRVQPQVVQDNDAKLCSPDEM